MEAHLNIGSNLGDRTANIHRAVALIRIRLGAPVEVSRPHTSAPWGYQSPNEYINVGVVLTLPDTARPLQLLHTLTAIEREISPASHRKPDGSYADRLIDIDIIAIDSQVIDLPQLRVPHPRMHLRRFVLAPMAELRPHWQHPLLGLTAAELLRHLLEAGHHSGIGAEC